MKTPNPVMVEAGRKAARTRKLRARAAKAARTKMLRARAAKAAATRRSN
jgi:hypothetical protein